LTSDLCCAVLRIFFENPDLFILYNLFAAKPLSQLSEWFTVNRLSFNLSKTCYSTFGAKSKINTGLRFYVDGQEVQKTQCCKYLGLLIDSRLKWCDHTSYVYNKLI